ncbi:hypothetical protein WH50_14830 [Pokkaliibacter plantistimulans]|uniref:Uncharacterized protein n=1 Tax=Pokkaliibacter plantistimulans TaxID=1635171 RepID=A0ABX5LV09_9GAMM|nr:hypothetical protein [Pokkaliibacter plantistimulans]PXF30505.1 hypothetical protein WH50_14830 [Pokkaliibacter plantistimulans]
MMSTYELKLDAKGNIDTQYYLSQSGVKLNSNGNVDTEYYVELSKQLRYEYMAELGAALKAKIKSLFRVELPKLSSSH